MTSETFTASAVLTAADCRAFWLRNVGHADCPGDTLEGMRQAVADYVSEVGECLPCLSPEDADDVAACATIANVIFFRAETPEGVAVKITGGDLHYLLSTMRAIPRLIPLARDVESAINY